MVYKVKTIVSMTDFVHVPCFGRSYNHCVIHKTIVDHKEGMN